MYIRRSFRLIFLLIGISIFALLFKLLRDGIIYLPIVKPSLPISEWIVRNFGSLPWLGPLADALGVFSFTVGMLFGFIEVLDARLRRQPRNHYTVIRNAEEIFPILYGEVSIKRARHSNIPYYERKNLGNLHKKAYEQLQHNPHLILLGDSGVGKLGN